MIENLDRRVYHGADTQPRHPFPPTCDARPSCSRCAAIRSACSSGSARRPPFEGAWSLPGRLPRAGHALERVDPHPARAQGRRRASCRGSSSSRRSATRTATPASGSSPPRTSGWSRAASTRRCRRTPPGTRSTTCRRARLRPRADRARRPRAAAGQAVVHEHRLRARAGDLHDVGAVGDLHRRARLPGRPHEPAAGCWSAAACSSRPASGAPPAPAAAVRRRSTGSARASWR